MTTDTKESPPKRPPMLEWLVRANGEVSSWVASMAWWRLFLLFIIILAAGSILSEQLHLRHDSVKVVRSKDKNVDVTIGGPDGVRIVRRHPAPAVPGASAPGEDVPSVPAVPGAKASSDGDDDD